MKGQDKFLGMDRSITRRNFLQGVAMSIAASRLGRAQTEAPSTSYPPSLHGIRGQDSGSTELGHRIRDGKAAVPADVVDTGESYDLIVIGAGLAGLCSSYVYKRERSNARILLLDNQDDFGGHARRNTFEHNGTTLIAPGGTFALENPEDSPRGAKEILESLEIDIDLLEGYRDREVFKRYGLSDAVFFDPRTYPGIKPTWVNQFYDIPYREFFRRSGIPEEAQRELVSFYTSRRMYLAGPERESKLAGMTWERFIREVMGLGDDAVRFANLYSTDHHGLGCDAVSALDGFELGPGFSGMGGPGFVDRNGIPRYGYQPVHRFPDGNHTIARMLLRRILPAAVPVENVTPPEDPEETVDTMAPVFNSRVRYDQLDRPEHRVRVCLRSLAIRVEQIDNGSRVAVHYMQPDGRVHRVTARSAIVASWGMTAKHIVPELPPEQKSALEEYRYTSALYINVLLKHWRPIADIGAFEMQWPGGYCTWMHVSDPLLVGDYQPEYAPDKPTVLSMYKYLYTPGLPPSDQMKLGRLEMESKPFEDYEREIRTELNHALGPWGFDAAEDILAITVNRWGHGYNFFQPSPGEEKPPYQLGRRRVGRISFAGADSGGSPWTQEALHHGRRAAYEQLSRA